MIRVEVKSPILAQVCTECDTSIPKYELCIETEYGRYHYACAEKFAKRLLRRVEDAKEAL